jgi:hypothetical protein
VSHLILRLFLVPIGVGFAALTALGVGLVGLLASGLGHNLANFLAAIGLSVLAAALTNVDPDDIASFIGSLSLLAIGILVVPIALVALAGEIFAISNWALYAFGTGLAFGAVPILFPGDNAHGWPQPAKLGFFATGLAAGTVYWLIAGRSAQRPRLLEGSPRSAERRPHA